MNTRRDPLGSGLGYFCAASSLLPIPTMIKRGWDISTLGLGLAAVAALVLGLLLVRTS